VPALSSGPRWHDDSGGNARAASSDQVDRPKGPASFPKRDRLRAYIVLVDGTEIARIRLGETHDLSVSPGRHAVKIKIDWTGSEPLTVSLSSGEVAQLLCEPAGRAITGL
jgi:hypothetical protein